jgi:hypothetical protein
LEPVNNGAGSRNEGEFIVKHIGAALLSLTLFASWSSADEGMWLFNHPPRDLLKKKYDFDLTSDWLDRAMKASVRFSGASGAIVSPRGLVATNHHVGSDTIQKLSTSGRDLYRDGFQARSIDDELKCPGVELIVLQGIDDVTPRVQATVKPAMKPAEAAAARKAIIARIESETKEQTGLRGDVVTLYQGGLYHLYRYKKYTDIRLVFAPEQAIANFGGDVDNFEYPRYCLDVCFFRVYEDGKPAATPNYLRWSTKGPAEGDLVFVTGHPGSTNRRETLARLIHRRDFTLPSMQAKLRYQENLLLRFAERGQEESRQAGADLYGVANARKFITGQYHGLLDPQIVAQKNADEEMFKARLRKQEVEKPQQERTEIESAFRAIADSQNKLREIEKEYQLLETGDALWCRHFRYARHLARLPTELKKPNEVRLPEYRDTALEALKLQFLADAPFYPELEIAKLTASLAFMAEQLGGGHPSVKKLLAQSPGQVAARVLQSSKLHDAAARKSLLEDAWAGKQAKDAMVNLVLEIEDQARFLRQSYETNVEEPERQAYAALSNARFQLDGLTVPPDATFTLRLAFGQVKGYHDVTPLPNHTQFGDAFARAEKQKYRAPFELPKSWLTNKEKVDPKTPFNFAATSDTIGGNSGSPVLNRTGELVGLNFDRNRHGLVRNYVYTDTQARHVSVHCRAVLEALDKIYDSRDLLKELRGK